MTSAPLISVVVVDDGVPSADAILRDLREQSFVAWEAIVVGGRVPGDVPVPEPGDMQVRRLARPSPGVPAARNAGVQAARAGWLLFLEPGDVLERDHLAMLWSLQECWPEADVLLADQGWADGAEGSPPEPRRGAGPMSRSLAAGRPLPWRYALIRTDAVRGLAGPGPGQCSEMDWDLEQLVERGATVCVAGNRPPGDVAASGGREDVAALLGRISELTPGAATGVQGLGGEPLIVDVSLGARLVGMAIAGGHDVSGLPVRLDMGGSQYPDPALVAGDLLDGMTHGLEDANPDWPAVWDRLGPLAESGLASLLGPDRGDTVRLAITWAERRLAGAQPPGAETRIGRFAVRTFDLGAGMSVRTTPPGVERIIGIVTREGRPAGQFEAFAVEIEDRAILSGLLSDYAGPETLEPGAGDRGRADLAGVDGIRAHEMAPVSDRRGVAPNQGAATRHPGVAVLMYHRIADDPLPALARWAVSPEAFRGQMHWLRTNGFTPIDLASFEAAVWDGASLPERPVLLTFDDGYRDFQAAASVLTELGMPATVFLPTDHVGGRAEWDSRFGPQAAIMGWDEIRALAGQGIDFAAHSRRHRPLAALPYADLLPEIVDPPRVIAAELGRPVTAMAYPYGSYDEAVARSLHHHGCRLAFTTQAGRWRRGGQALAIPRIEVPNGLGLDGFARLLTE